VPEAGTEKHCYTAKKIKQMVSDSYLEGIIINGMAITKDGKEIALEDFLRSPAGGKNDYLLDSPNFGA